MRWKDLFEHWGLKKLKLKTPFLETEFEPKDPDKNAAWALYVELVTRVTTQRLPLEHGDEKTALESVYQLFPLTRDVLKQNRGCDAFAKVAVVMLNQVIRPFTAKWHGVSVSGGFGQRTRYEQPGESIESKFRADLEILQTDLRNYARLLAELADVEDLTDLEE